MKNNQKFEINIVFDNKCKNEGFLTGFGFGALIFNPYTNNFSLFDTGGNGRVLIHNIKRFGVKINEIKNVVISHSHSDHSGGLAEIVEKAPHAKIFVPNANQSSFQRKFPDQEIIGVEKSYIVEKNMESSGQFGQSIKEEALYLKKENGKIFIIVGCTHPGLESFIIKAREMGEIEGVIGGFHGFNKYSYLEGIKFIGACHCTAHINAIKKKFPNNYNKICVGDSVLF